MKEEFLVAAPPLLVFDYISDGSKWIDILSPEKPARVFTRNSETSWTYKSSVDIRWTYVLAKRNPKRDDKKNVGMSEITYDIAVGYNLDSDPITKKGGTPEFTFKVEWYLWWDVTDQARVRRKVYDFKHLGNTLLPYLCVLKRGLNAENKNIQNHFLKIKKESEESRTRTTSTESASGIGLDLSQ